MPQQTFKYFNPRKLKEARLSRGLTIKDLAEKIDVKKQSVSQYELGQSVPSKQTLMSIINTLQFPKDYFYLHDKNENIGNTFFRSDSRTSQKLKEMQRIRVNWLAKIHEYLGGFINFPTLNLPDIEEYGDYDLHDWDDDAIEDLAILVRNYWGLGDKPIKNMVNLLEQNGIVVSSFEIADERIDAFCQRRGHRTIVMLSNDKISAARRNFDCAHELGHILMHHHIIDDQDQLSKEDYRLMEAQVSRFSSAFLLPEESFINSIYSYKLEDFIELKKYWRVSIAAMVRRCFDLQLITYNQYTYLNKQLSSKKWRKNEPLDNLIDLQEPTTLKRAIKMVIEEGYKTKEEIMMDLLLPQSDIEMLVNLNIGELNHYEYKQPTPLPIVSNHNKEVRENLN